MNEALSPDATIPSEYVSADEVAVYLDISKKAVYELADKKVLPCYRVGRRLRFLMFEIHEAIQALRVA
jgi:excisionase family DNA binding protein